MTSTTKHALADSLKRLMAKKPLPKITIADITEDCGINRMTFYYHFQDIYDLIDWICREEAAQAMNGKWSYETWQEGLTSVVRAVVENRVFVEGVYRSVRREQLEAYLFDAIYSLLISVIDEISEGSLISQESKEYVANFYKYAFAGILMAWVKNGFRESPEALVGQIAGMARGQLRAALRNMQECEMKNVR